MIGLCIASIKEMRYFLFIIVWFASCHLTVMAQEENQADSSAVVTNSFWDNWYGQVGVNMNLLFPYGKNIKGVFPNGKSFGIDLAVGKWFSPEFGGRLKLNWGNGILKNDHNTWLRPEGKPGENHRNGGFVTFIGDIQFNLHNLFGVYQPDRKWNIIAAPRAGGWIDIGSGEGAPLLGVGIINTYRLSDRTRLYADIGYHFLSSINGSRSGEGHGSNGFVDINVGIEVDLSSKNKFNRVKTKIINNPKSVELNHFWDNWFVQAGIGMSLINAYGTNFKNVFPNGKTFGVNFGLGKWFTPEIGIRGGLNWQNGIVGNHHADYLDYDGPGHNYRKHGYIALYGDLFFNLHNAIGGYDEQRKWNAIIYPRMGLCKNFSSEYEESPVLGLGTEQTYVINDKWKIFADVNYQVTTSGFLNSKFSTGDTGGSNGWFDINIGVQYELGQVVGWHKLGEKRGNGSGFRVQDSHNWPRFIVNTGASVVVAFGAKTTLKAIIKEERPDHSDNKSFPSGHAAIAFAAARSIDKEFRKDCIWIPIAGYAAATAIGIERVASDRHHWYDVVAGAGVGFGAAELTWWLSDLMFGKGSNVSVGTSGNTVDVTYNF